MVTLHGPTTLGSRRHLGPIALGALFVAGLFAGPAAADIYWATEFSRGKPSLIGCARSNGSHVNPTFISGTGLDVTSLSADGRYVYWGDRATNSIGRGKTNGRGVKRKLIRNAGFDRATYNGLANDGQYLYWAARIDRAYTIARASIDGTGVNTAFMPVEARSLAVGGGRLVWTDFAWVFSANGDGTGVQVVYDDVPTQVAYIADVATDGARAFWTYSTFSPGFDPFKISAAFPDGTGLVEAFVANVGAYDLAADGKYLYWADGENAIGRVRLDGSGLDRRFIRTKEPPYAVAVGAGRRCPSERD